MRLMYQHEKPGQGLVIVRAPKDLPVFVTVDGSFDHRSVEVVINDGRELAAWAGPSGPGNRDFSVEVGKPSASSFLKDFFGFRTGASVSGGGVTASGRDSIASRGDITGNAVGRGAVVASGDRSVATGGSGGVIITGNSNSVETAFSKGDRRFLSTGVHLFLPFHCEFDAKNDNEVTVTVGEQQVDLNEAYLHSYVEAP